MPVVYTYCEKCKAYIAIDVPPDTIQRQNVFPFPYSYVHVMNAITKGTTKVMLYAKFVTKS